MLDPPISHPVRALCEAAVAAGGESNPDPDIPAMLEALDELIAWAKGDSPWGTLNHGKIQ